MLIGLLEHSQIVPVACVEKVQQRGRQQLIDDQRDHSHYRLIDKVDQKDGQQIGQKIAHRHHAVDARRHVDSVALTEVQSVDEPGQQSADNAAQKGKGHDPEQDIRDLEAAHFLGKGYCRHRDQYADDAVVDREGIGKAVDDIGKEADRDTRDVSSQHRREDRTDVVNEQRQPQYAVELCAEDIQQYADDDDADQRRDAFP